MSPSKSNREQIEGVRFTEECSSTKNELGEGGSSFGLERIVRKDWLKVGRS
jgi:hypothetical protein